MEKLDLEEESKPPEEPDDGLKMEDIINMEGDADEIQQYQNDF